MLVLINSFDRVNRHTIRIASSRSNLGGTHELDILFPAFLEGNLRPWSPSRMSETTSKAKGHRSSLAKVYKNKVRRSSKSHTG